MRFKGSNNVFLKTEGSDTYTEMTTLNACVLFGNASSGSKLHRSQTEFLLLVKIA